MEKAVVPLISYCEREDIDDRVGLPNTDIRKKCETDDENAEH
jgi:hypothetical protein